MTASSVSQLDMILSTYELWNMSCAMGEVLFSYSFSFDPSLWWPLRLSMAAHKGHVRFPKSCQASRIT